jgi:hypothetical protein
MAWKGCRREFVKLITEEWLSLGNACLVLLGLGEFRRPPGVVGLTGFDISMRVLTMDRLCCNQPFPSHSGKKVSERLLIFRILLQGLV